MYKIRNEYCMKVLKESHDLSKGIFWVKDYNDINNTFIYFDIPCDINGYAQDDSQILNAKSGNTFNHEKTWKSLPKSITENKPFNYFPRGRVEINNGKAIIYCSPYICNNVLKKIVISKFNLTEFNGIKTVRLIADNSEHYKCYLD